MTSLTDCVALAIAKHFRGDKQPPMDDAAASALFGGAAAAAIHAQRQWDTEYLRSLSHSEFEANIRHLRRIRE